MKNKKPQDYETIQIAPQSENFGRKGVRFLTKTGSNKIHQKSLTSSHKYSVGYVIF